MSFFMRCGCRANATTKRGEAFVPSCAIHDCTDVADAPNLADRMARCACGATAPSSLDLPFFEFCGAGSREATEICKCGYNTVAHKKPDFRCKTGGFSARGPRDDRYYCGHSGWD